LRAKAGCVVAAASIAVSAAAPPLRLAIYYGYPSLVEQSSGDTARAAAVFGRYDAIVFGDGLELPEAETIDAGLKGERQRIAPLIRAIHDTPRRPLVYGYIALGSTQNLTLTEIDRRVERWRLAGADGIFFDEAGRDFGVDAMRRRVAVCAAHGRGLRAFMNAFDPDDLFAASRGTRNGCDGALGARDAILIESFAVRNGIVQTPDAIDTRVTAALQWRQRTGVHVFAVTTAGDRPFSRDAFDAALKQAASHGLDGFGWGEKNFSADSRLPWRYP